MKKLVLCLLFLILLLGSFVNAETCLSESKCNRCPGNQDTPKSYTLKVEDVKNCADDSLSELNGKTNLVRYLQDWGKCMYYTPGGDGYPIYTELFILNNEGLRVNVISGDTMYFQFNPTSCTETMETEFLSDISCDSSVNKNPLYVYGGTATLTPCKENNPPTIINVPKVVYIKEKANILSLSKVDEKSGKMKINSLIYDTVISDGETKVEDLKLQIGSSKITPATPANPVNFGASDLGLVYSQLPKIDRFILNVTDDGTIDGQTEKGETKSTVNDPKVIWCPENVTLYSAYSVRLVSNGTQKKATFGFNDNDIVIEKASKTMTLNLMFTNDKKVPIKGQLKINILNQREGSLYWTLEMVDTGRSKAIKELQKRLEKSLGKLPNNEEIAKWGCKDGKWGSYDFGENVVMDVCKEYADATITYKTIYNFEKSELTISGGSGTKTDQIKIKVPLNTFIILSEEFKDDKASASSKVKVDLRYPEDWSKGGMKPSDMIKKMQNLLLVCDINKNQNKVIEAEKDTVKKTITTTSKKSYYYVQEFQSEEDSAIKISLNVPLLEPITKIFSYSQINFTDEEALSLFRYEDDEIENLCYVNALSKTNFSISPAGGNFSVQDLEIIIPENAVETNGILTIAKVNVTNCIKDIDANLNKKINLNEMLSYLKSSIEINESFPGQRVLELLLRWRIG